MSYDNMGGIVQKNQTASLNYPGYPGEKYNYYYTQGNTAPQSKASKSTILSYFEFEILFETKCKGT